MNRSSTAKDTKTTSRGVGEAETISPKIPSLPLATHSREESPEISYIRHLTPGIYTGKMSPQNIWLQRPTGLAFRRNTELEGMESPLLEGSCADLFTQ